MFCPEGHLYRIKYFMLLVAKEAWHSKFLKKKEALYLIYYQNGILFPCIFELKSKHLDIIINIINKIISPYKIKFFQSIPLPQGRSLQSSVQ